MQKPIRVLLVDDHELFRQGISAVLDRDENIEVVGQAENGQVAVRKCRDELPDVVLMDINMPIMDGLEATRQVKHENPHIVILILTVSDEEQMLFDAIKAGASGYVLKNASPADVVQSIQRVYSGEPVIPGKLALQIISEFSVPTPSPTAKLDPVDELTAREDEVLVLLSSGATNREIASKLFISENTVRNHVRNILEKLHVANRVEAAAYAIREGYTATNHGNSIQRYK